MEPVGSSETSVNIYQAKRQHIPEDNIQELERFLGRRNSRGIFEQSFKHFARSKPIYWKPVMKSILLVGITISAFQNTEQDILCDVYEL
jgi:hypothetical protein